MATVSGVRLGDDQAAARSLLRAPGSMVQSAVLIDVEVVLDHHHRAYPTAVKPVQHLQQKLTDVVEVETRGRLVEDV